MANERKYGDMPTEEQAEAWRSSIVADDNYIACLATNDAKLKLVVLVEVLPNGFPEDVEISIPISSPREDLQKMVAQNTTALKSLEKDYNEKSLLELLHINSYDVGGEVIGIPGGYSDKGGFTNRLHISIWQSPLSHKAYLEDHSKGCLKAALFAKKFSDITGLSLTPADN